MSALQPRLRPGAVVQRAEEAPEGASRLFQGPLSALVIEDYIPAPVPQRMGGNLSFERGAPSDFMFTEGGRGSMRFDLLEGGSLSRVMGGVLGQAHKKSLMGSGPSLDEVLNRILQQVHGIKTNKEARDEVILTQGVEDLGEMIQTGKTMCWEKAGFMHMLLAEMGIASQIVSGKSRKKASEHHAWVEILGTPFAIESTAGFIALAAEYEHRFEIYDRKTVARPKFGMHPSEVRSLLESNKNLRKGAISSLSV